MWKKSYSEKKWLSQYFFFKATIKLKQLRCAKKETYRKEDRFLYRQGRNILIRKIRVAKRSYFEKLKNQLSANELANVWRSLKNIIGRPSSITEENRQPADNLNVFYCGFERRTLSSIIVFPHLRCTSNSQISYTYLQLSGPPPLVILE